MSRIASEVGFVHLRVHSAYSLLEGALPIKKLAELAAADRMPALGIADTGNLFGALEFAEKMVEKGIQPIIGCQVALDFGDGGEPGGRAPLRQKPLFDIVLIAATEAGYWNLVRLVSNSFMDTSRRARPYCAWRVSPAATGGLIALTGGPGGPIDRAIAAGQSDLAAARLPTLAALFRRPALCRAAAPRARRARRRSSRISSTSPTGTACRWSRPTSRSSRRGTTTRPMMR